MMVSALMVDDGAMVDLTALTALTSLTVQQAYKSVFHPVTCASRKEKKLYSHALLQDPPLHRSAGLEVHKVYHLEHLTSMVV